ncbi:hypothetical protein AVEN_233180-1 [Araneus ventricosus]|uniref:Uncharacterized protein n=1 Tax=Araneus ventricosus TaxID=182803 RepID=A0A4Y2EK27_ARAVE|nr:hypothetical protein AVEN_233180-1 [Araneus ventricosus]
MVVFTNACLELFLKICYHSVYISIPTSSFTSYKGFQLCETYFLVYLIFRGCDNAVTEFHLCSRRVVGLRPEEDSSCIWAWCMLNLLMFKCPPVGVEWKFVEWGAG